jgi:N-carbamoylputrescine amidase
MQTMKEIKPVKVAAIQLESKHGSIKANHEHAVPFIEQAAQAGAQLVVLPELFTTGYIPNETIWDVAEPRNGHTVTWLKQTAKQFGIYLGAGLLETDGKDFFNIFVLCNPEGREAGRVSKIETESYVFKRTSGSHVIETPLGKIGVGICADNQMVSFLKQMAADNVDLMLMPHGWPTPCKTNQQVSEQDILDHRERTKRLASIYSEHLGVPAVFVNGVGPMGRMIGLLGKFMGPEIFRLEGRSRIVDSDGTIVGELGSEEGVIISIVTLDPTRKHYSEPESYDGWLLPGNAVSRKVIIPFDVSYGQLWYRLTPLRKKKAQEILTRYKINNR